MHHKSGVDDSIMTNNQEAFSALDAILPSSLCPEGPINSHNFSSSSHGFPRMAYSHVTSHGVHSTYGVGVQN